MDRHLRIINEMDPTEEKQRVPIPSLLYTRGKNSVLSRFTNTEPCLTFPSESLSKSASYSTSTSKPRYVGIDSILTPAVISNFDSACTIGSSSKTPRRSPPFLLNEFHEDAMVRQAYDDLSSNSMTSNLSGSIAQPKHKNLAPLEVLNTSQPFTVANDSAGASNFEGMLRDSKSTLFNDYPRASINTALSQAISYSGSILREQEPPEAKSKASMGAQVLPGESGSSLSNACNRSYSNGRLTCLHCGSKLTGSAHFQSHLWKECQGTIRTHKMRFRSPISKRVHMSPYVPPNNLNEDSRGVACPSAIKVPNLQSTPQPRVLSLSSVILAITLIKRNIERRLTKKIKLKNLQTQLALPQYDTGDGSLENKYIVDADLWSWFSTSQTSKDSIENISVDSFEEYDTENSQDDTGLDSTCLPMETNYAGSKELFDAIQPCLDRLPRSEVFGLATKISYMFEAWLEFYKPSQCVGYTSVASSTNNQDCYRISQPSSPLTGGNKKILPDGSDDDIYPHSDDGQDGRKRRRKMSVSPQQTSKRWACPYYQREPYRYCMRGQFGDYRSCSKSPGFSEVHRVKTHLYHHHAAIYCRRCYSQFKSKEDLRRHERASLPCDLQVPQSLEGLDENQRDLLKPQDRNKSEEDRWRAVYKICFPDDRNVPSPYYIHYTQEVAILRRDIIAIAEEETISAGNFDRERLLQRLRDAFDINAQRSRSSLSRQAAGTLPTPSGSDTSRQLGESRISSLPPSQEFNMSIRFPEDSVVDNSATGEPNDALTSIFPADYDSPAI